MREVAQIEYELGGQTFVYKGGDYVGPDHLAGAFFETLHQVKQERKPTTGETIRTVIERLGGKITGWKSIRPDGTIHGRDLRGSIIH
jgi:hypothetical protein